MQDILDIFECGANSSETYNDQFNYTDILDPLELCNVSFWDLSELLGNDPIETFMQKLNVYITPIIIFMGVTGKQLIKYQYIVWN